MNSETTMVLPCWTSIVNVSDMADGLTQTCVVDVDDSERKHWAHIGWSEGGVRASCTNIPLACRRAPRLLGREKYMKNRCYTRSSQINGTRTRYKSRLFFPSLFTPHYLPRHFFRSELLLEARYIPTRFAGCLANNAGEQNGQGALDVSGTVLEHSWPKLSSIVHRRIQTNTTRKAVASVVEFASSLPVCRE